MTKKIIETLPGELHQAGCPCCSPVSSGTSRRQFLATGAAVLAGGMMGFVPGRSMAGGGNYEAMLINCIDPRFTTLSWQYMGLLSGVDREKLGDNYSHFVMAGGPIGAIHPKFAACIVIAVLPSWSSDQQVWQIKRLKPALMQKHSRCFVRKSTCAIPN